MRPASLLLIGVCVAACTLLAHSQPIASEDPGRVFSRVYSTREWGEFGGGSGQGSTINATHGVRHILHDFFERNDVHTMADVPCGSFHWMRLFIRGRDDVTYIGLDAATEVIKGLQTEFAPGKGDISDRVTFNVRTRQFNCYVLSFALLNLFLFFSVKTAPPNKIVSSLFCSRALPLV